MCVVVPHIAHVVAGVVDAARCLDYRHVVIVSLLIIVLCLYIYFEVFLDSLYYANVALYSYCDYVNLLESLELQSLCVGFAALRCIHS
jgi:hypothetical protein